MTILVTNYCKIITNYGKNLLQITAALIFVNFKTITNYVKFYNILRQLLVLLQITANFITNYGRYYKLRRYYNYVTLASWINVLQFYFISKLFTVFVIQFIEIRYFVFVTWWNFRVKGFKIYFRSFHKIEYLLKSKVYLY